MTRAAGTKKRGRGKAEKTLVLIETARRFYAAQQPASVRAACYHLFIHGLIPNMGKSATDGVSKQLVWAREQGIIPWDWISDETREAERVSTWDNPEQIIDAAVRGYRKDYWSFQPRRVEVWSEKGTIRGTVAPVLNKYGVTFRVMHGYTSATSIYEIAEESVADAGKPLTVLYIGDWDCSGLHMSEVDLPRRLERYGGEATMERIALTAEDVAPGTGLPSFDVQEKAKDPRYKWFVPKYGMRCWEVDALPPAILRTRLEARIVELLDMDAWDQAVAVERAETQSMQDFMGRFKSILRPATKYSGSAD